MTIDERVEALNPRRPLDGPIAGAVTLAVIVIFLVFFFFPAIEAMQ